MKEEQTINGLPKDWKWVKFEEVCEKVEAVKRKEKKAEEELLYLDIGGIDNQSNKIVSHKNYKWSDAPSRAQQIVYKGDILFSTVRTYLKNIAVVDCEIHNGQIASSGFCVIRANGEILNPKFAFYYTISESFLGPLNELQTGSSYPAVRDKDVFDQPFPLPPIEVQQQIVSKIEELFSELDKSIEELKIAQQQLKVYRQAVLKWAFEGKLTNENVKDGALPEGWKWVKSGELFEFVTSGSRGWAKYYSDKGAIFIRITNLDFDSIDLDLAEDKIQYVNPPSNSEGIRTKVQEGDFLFSITGYLGMFAIAPALENAYVNQHISLCRPRDGFNKKYVGYWIISKAGGYHYLNKMRKGAIKAGLGLDDIKGFPVPVCTLEEQQQIVQEIESRLSVCDKIEETITASLKQAEALRQSILKKAFEGKLLQGIELA